MIGAIGTYQKSCPTRRVGVRIVNENGSNRDLIRPKGAPMATLVIQQSLETSVNPVTVARVPTLPFPAGVTTEPVSVYVVVEPLTMTVKDVHRDTF